MIKRFSHDVAIGVAIVTSEIELQKAMNKTHSMFPKNWPGRLLIAFCLTGLILAGSATSAVAEVKFELSRPGHIHPKPFTGRVLVMLGPENSRSPKSGPDWFNPQPMFAIDVKDWAVDQPIKLADGPNLISFPAPLSKLKPGKYAAQALMRVNMTTHRLGNGPGNAFSDVVQMEVADNQDVTVKMAITATQPEDTFPEHPRVKLETLESPLLSAFYGRPVRHRASVVLPEGRNAKTALPSIYIIPGFGGDHRQGLRMAGRSGGMNFGSDMVRIVLDPDCVTGHHVFADSATNGPRGKALVEEFIPYLEKKYNLISKAEGRFLNGHSSGGWSSLWLQVTYPDTFGGVWSTSPDPIDFRDFQRIDIYAKGENMFRDRQGVQRPIARRGNQPVVSYETFSKMEEVMGPGGQLYSFEAVFSPVGADKEPKQLWNRRTGVIDLNIAETWKKYDIGLILQENWSTLGPKLAGKIHITMGDMDSFYLEGATRLMGERLKALKSDAVVDIIPGRDHGSVLDSALGQRIDAEIHETLKRNGIPLEKVKMDDSSKKKTAAE